MPYLPGLDGLRALAVTAVLLYHTGLGFLPGGFLGVEVFFVISGYLITALLLSEWRQRGRIDLGAFWLRRARRLLPALYLVILVTLTFAVAFLPEEVARLRDDALAALGYVTNWYLIFANQSYFETVGRPSLLQHLWSLAVEEQFYVLWPPLLAAGLWIARRRWHRRVVLYLMLVAGAVGSSVLMAHLYSPDADPSRLYYGTDTRATGLLIGAALAFMWVPGSSPKRPRRYRRSRGRGWVTPLLLNALGLAALCGLVLSCLLLDEAQPFLYRGGFALVAVVTAVAIAVSVHPRAWLLGEGLLGWWPVRWIGLRSYGIYLWHWPVFTVTRPELDVPFSGWPLLVLRLALTLALAGLSYRYVETPIRRGALGRSWRALREARGSRRWRLGVRWIGAATTGTAFCAVLGVAVALAEPPAPPSYLAAMSEAPVHTESPAQQTPSATTEIGAVAPESAGTMSAGTGDGVPEGAGSTNATAGSASTEPASASKPAPSPGASVGGKISAIGDSVMLGAAGDVQEAIGDDLASMDALVGLQVYGAIDILRQHRDDGSLGQVVVVHLGTNGTFTEEQFDELMDVLKDTRKVVFVNIKAPRLWEEPNNEVLSEGVGRYPEKAVLVDWHAASANRPDIFWDDGIHLRPEGAQLYADLISASAKPEGSPGPSNDNAKSSASP